MREREDRERVRRGTARAGALDSELPLNLVRRSQSPFLSSLATVPQTSVRLGRFLPDLGPTPVLVFWL